MKKLPTDVPPRLSHNPFQTLKLGRASLPPGPVAGSPPVPKQKPPPARAVVRLERKGRGGKEVTVVEQLGLRDKELNAILRLLKQTLGCGGTVEDQGLVLQGDQRERTCAALAALGVQKVIRGT